MNEVNEARHPIGVVARRTGVSLHVLRAWERRYGVVSPVRSSGGQRLYSDADIARLRLLRQVTDAGRNISQVAGLSDAELAGLAREDVHGELLQTAAEPAAEVESYVAASLAAGERMDGDAVHATLMRAVVALRPAEFLSGVVQPLLHEVGVRWHGGTLGPAQEHVVSVAVRRVLTWLIEAYESPADAPLLVVTTAAGEHHEFGAMQVGVLALDEGWRVAYLGPSLPAGEIVRGAQLLRASMVAVSVVAGARNGADPVAEMAALVAALPAGVPVLVGGAAAVDRQAELESAGARVAGELDAARRLLRLQREQLHAGAG
jgi:MerR family transcriptional regulator, light-induced transcriptional regulator